MSKCKDEMEKVIAYTNNAVLTLKSCIDNCIQCDRKHRSKEFITI